MANIITLAGRTLVFEVGWGPMVSWVLAVQMDSLECECVYGALRVVLGSVCSLDVSPPLLALVFVNCSTLTQCQ